MRISNTPGRSNIPYHDWISVYYLVLARSHKPENALKLHEIAGKIRRQHGPVCVPNI